MSNALELSELSKTYDNGVKALNGVSFDVAQGDFFALLGPNGAGKSTTIGIMSSLVRKTAGVVRVFGFDLDREPNKVKRMLGVVPQEFNFNIFETPEQILMNQAGFYGLAAKHVRGRCELYLKSLGLWDKRGEKAGKLSGGMKRRLLIARALIHEPPLLILDEPTAGVDIELRRMTWQFLKEINQKGTTIILTTHYLEEAENLCQNLAIIDRGQLIEHTSTNALLKKLNTETFVFYLETLLSEAPSLRGFSCHLTDETTLEIEVSNQQSLTALFEQLAEAKIKILSMRNKTNRLEELFLKLLKEGKEA